MPSRVTVTGGLCIWRDIQLLECIEQICHRFQGQLLKALESLVELTRVALKKRRAEIKNMKCVCQKTKLMVFSVFLRVRNGRQLLIPLKGRMSFSSMGSTEYFLG